MWTFEATRDSQSLPTLWTIWEDATEPETDLVPGHRVELGGGGARALQGHVFIAVCSYFFVAVGGMKQQQQLGREDTEAHQNSNPFHSLDAEKERLVTNASATKGKAGLTFIRVSGVMSSAPPHAAAAAAVAAARLM